MKGEKEVETKLEKNEGKGSFKNQAPPSETPFYTLEMKEWKIYWIQVSEENEERNTICSWKFNHTSFLWSTLQNSGYIAFWEKEGQE